MRLTPHETCSYDPWLWLVKYSPGMTMNDHRGPELPFAASCTPVFYTPVNVRRGVRPSVDETLVCPLEHRLTLPGLPGVLGEGGEGCTHL